MNLFIILASIIFSKLCWSQPDIHREKSKSILFQTRSSENTNSKKSQVIRYSVVEAWSEPYAFYDGDRNLVDGLIKELIEALSRKLDSSFEHVYVSRNRVESGVEKGQVDVRCFINEAWTEKPDLYAWSQVWYEISNIVVWKKGRSPVKKIDDLDSKTLGTTSGYMYKAVNDLFKSGKVKRSDVATEVMNLTLLQKDRIDYALVERTSFEWFLKVNGDDIKGYEMLMLERIPLKCAISKASNIKVEDINEAISKLRLEGFFKRLELKYGYKKS